MVDARYSVEQLGYRDYGVWDAQDERWVFEGDRDDCDDKADRLNKGTA